MFSAGQEVVNFLISYGILSKAWEESLLVSDSESFRLEEYELFAFVTFPSFHKIRGFIVEENEYGECNIQTDRGVFSAYLKGSADQPALVHQGALNLFLNIMEKTNFQRKMQVYTDSKQRKLKPIIFVGHSLGGAVATLATLWVLEKRLRQSSPFCITFGCPLVGDVNLVEAVGCENWGGNFLHVISQHDIVPRMLLAPLKSIAQPLTAILPYWNGKIAYSFIQDACRTLLNIVLQCTYTVANHEVDSSGRSDVVIKRSPYKPFGTYMFCSSNGAACFDDSETVLKLLSLTMPSYEELHDSTLKDWFSEHIDYGPILERVKSHIISGSRIAHSNSESSLEVIISVQRDALGVEPGTQDDPMGTLLSRPVEMENHFIANVNKLAIELSNKGPMMAELEHYKGSCEKGDIGYYDSFKNQNTLKDIYVDQRRLHLALFWDEIIEMWESRELPSDFQSQNKWINAGNSYSRLVEPLDIAHYYRTNSLGNYLSDGRPNRYKVLQKWMEEKEKKRGWRWGRRRTKRASLTSDSCFWAHVEEALKDLENLKQGQHQSLQNLENFEVYVTELGKSLSISSDAFLAGSSFILWWEDWEKYNINKSPEWRSSLYEILENESIKPPLNEIPENESPVEFDDIKTPSNEKLENESPFESESIKSDTGEQKLRSFSDEQGDEDLPFAEEYCDNTGQDNIPSTKEPDFDKLSSIEIELELSQHQGCVSELEWYKMICHEKGDGYYDSFKNRNDNDSSDSKSILLRVTLNDFWEGIVIGICNSGLLPSNFQSRNMWINAGTAYRKLVEPLDIANYYSTSSKDSGSYLHRRPARYEVLEQWLKDRKEKLKDRKENRSSRGKKADDIKLPFLTRDSCFWARVEDALKELKEADQNKASLENFEKYVTKMINDCNISSDIFLEGSSFMKWWRDYKQHQTSEWKSKSPLYNLKSPFWKP